jgi:hypothetical protein
MQTKILTETKTIDKHCTRVINSVENYIHIIKTTLIIFQIHKRSDIGFLSTSEGKLIF